MIKKSNTRIMITLSKEQAKWLEKNSKKLNMSVSKFCKWLMDKNIGKLASYLTQDEWNQLRKIAKTPWIKLDEDDN